MDFQLIHILRRSMTRRRILELAPRGEPEAWQLHTDLGEAILASPLS